MSNQKLKIRPHVLPPEVSIFKIIRPNSCGFIQNNKVESLKKCSKPFMNILGVSGVNVYLEKASASDVKDAATLLSLGLQGTLSTRGEDVWCEGRGMVF